MAAKWNVMRTGVLWREEVTHIHDTEFKDMKLTHILADNCAMQLLKNPRQFDVIVTDNLFGDILSDIAAMLTGSLGMLPSASLGSLDPKTNKRHALYEPVHGSAPDIAGKGLANPIAQILSFAMALRYSFDLPEDAELIEKAVKVAPRRSEPYLCRAIYYMARDQYQKAFADLTTAASLRQVDEQIYQLRAYCQYKLGNYEAGLVDCKKALDLLPTYGLAFRNQGLLRDKLGDTKGAMWSYRDALTWDVRDIDTELKYADLCYKCGESSQCRVYVDNAFDVMKDPPAVAYLLRGRMAIDRQNFIDALRDYAKGCWKLVFEKRQDSLYGYYR